MVILNQALNTRERVEEVDSTSNFTGHVKENPIRGPWKKEVKKRGA